jgi:hypothetical protein
VVVCVIVVTVLVIDSVDAVTVSVTLCVSVTEAVDVATGVARVTVEAVTPKHEHALEYRTSSLQGDA